MDKITGDSRWIWTYAFLGPGIQLCSLILKNHVRWAFTLNPTYKKRKEKWERLNSLPMNAHLEMTMLRLKPGSFWDWKSSAHTTSLYVAKQNIYTSALVLRVLSPVSITPSDSDSSGSTLGRNIRTQKPTEYVNVCVYKYLAAYGKNGNFSRSHPLIGELTNLAWQAQSEWTEVSVCASLD